MNGCVNYLFSGYNTYLNELNTHLQSLEKLIFPLFGNVKAFTHIRKTRISCIFQLCWSVIFRICNNCITVTWELREESYTMVHDCRINNLIINLLLSWLSISTDEAPEERQMGCDDFLVCLTWRISSTILPCWTFITFVSHTKSISAFTTSGVCWV